MQVGDRVYAEDWCEGIIDEIDGDTAIVEFTTFCGGGRLSFLLKELQLIECDKSQDLRRE